MNLMQEIAKTFKAEIAKEKLTLDELNSLFLEIENWRNDPEPYKKWITEYDKTHKPGGFFYPFCPADLIKHSFYGGDLIALWEQYSLEERKQIPKLSNFNKKLFEELTGIDVLQEILNEENKNAN